jgi:hypothetical protein
MVQDYRGPVVTPLVLVGLVGASGLALALWNSRRAHERAVPFTREVARFRTDAGLAILDIPRDLEGSGDFERFVGRVVEQIRKVRAGTTARKSAPPE